MKRLTKKELQNAMERVKESEEASFEEMMDCDNVINCASKILSELDHELSGLFMHLEVDIPPDYSINDDHEEIGYLSSVLEKYIIWTHGWDIPTKDEDEFLEDVLDFENQIRDFESRIMLAPAHTSDDLEK